MRIVACSAAARRLNGRSSHCLNGAVDRKAPQQAVVCVLLNMMLLEAATNWCCCFDYSSRSDWCRKNGCLYGCTAFSVSLGGPLCSITTKSFRTSLWMLKCWYWILSTTLSLLMVPCLRSLLSVFIIVSDSLELEYTRGIGCEGVILRVLSSSWILSRVGSRGPGSGRITVDCNGFMCVASWLS